LTGKVYHNIRMESWNPSSHCVKLMHSPVPSDNFTYDQPQLGNGARHAVS